MPPDGTQGAGDSAKANGSQGAGDGTSERPAWFQAYLDEQKRDRETFTKDLDKRFEGFREKYVKDQDPEPKPAAGKEGPKPITRDDVQKHVSAAMKLGQLTAKLPEDARERIDQLLEDRGVDDALMVAEMLAESLPANGEEHAARAAPKGKGASPAPNGTGSPTKAELKALLKSGKDEDRKRYYEIVQADGFKWADVPES